MSEPFQFESASPRFALPLLFSAQSQKEVFVNEAFAITDALLHCCVEGEALTPPASPVDGESWLVAIGAIDEWEGQDGAVACRQAGNWIFITPRDGLRIFDKSADQEQFFFGSWRKAAAPVEPVGGMTVDAEARTAIADLVIAFRALGIFPSA